MTDRATRFLDRIDVFLPAFPDDEARRAFLLKQVDGWTERYSRFVATQGASEPITDRTNPPHCADFALTIAGLQARLETGGP